MLKQKFQSELESMIVKQTGLNKSRASFIALAVEGILAYESVLQKKMAQPFSQKKALPESAIRRVERFFANTQINTNDFSRMIVESIGIKDKVTLAMDRTTWCYGKKPINLFVVAIIWNNAAIPVIWDTLNKKGGSNTAERKRIIRRVISIIGIEKIEAILADREFIGHEWFSFLHRAGIPFIIRIKSNSYVTYDCGGRTQVKTIMRIVKPGGRWRSKVCLGKVPVDLVGTRSVNGELVIVAASRGLSGDVLNSYRIRWLIELCFRSLKSKGFNLEETHITAPDRINKLFAIVAIACLLVVKAGSLRALFKKIPVKNHGRPLFSIFTYGLDFLRNLFSRPFYKWEIPPTYKTVLIYLFQPNIEKSSILGIKNVGY